MNTQTLNIIDKTIAFWSERTGENVSHEDARQMVANVSGFFQVLAELDHQASEKEGYDK